MEERPAHQEGPKGGNHPSRRWSAFVDRLGRLPLARRTVAAWHWAWTTVRMLLLCGYAAIAALLVGFLFVVNDQGRDLLRISAERLVSAWNLLFFLGTAALALTLWYTSRLLLGREFDSYRLDLRNAEGRQRWLPRIFGISAPLSIALGLTGIESALYQTQIWFLTGAYLILGVLVHVFFKRRRGWFGVPPYRMIEDRVKAMPGGDLVLIWAAAILSFALLVAFMVWPVSLPQTLGAPAIVMLGLVGIVLFGSMVLTYAFLAYGQPAATALALALAVLFGFWVDNHDVRLSEDAPALVRAAPAEHYTRWRQAHPGYSPIAGREPVILVAASGGGIRAAYWTAANLAEADSLPGFGDNLFAISGVSGGSLGAATFTALRHVPGSDRSQALGVRVRGVLGSDFLSPVLAGLLFPDLAQRFLPFTVRAADRQRFLELSWEQAVGASVGETANPLSRAFTELYAPPQGPALPSLLLNATLVDSGRRAIVSNLDVRGFPDTLDLLAPDVSTHRILLSAAAGASARFTYVSPAGRLTWTQETPAGDKLEHRLRVVDGGYFENSGTATVMDLLTALRKAHGDRLYPILVLIRNDPNASAVCRRGSGHPDKDLSGDASSGIADDLLKEVATPIRALLNARTARGRLAEVGAARAVEASGGAVIEFSLAAVLQSAIEAAAGDEAKLALLQQRAIEPPLGWSLSEEVRQEMDRALSQRLGGLDTEYEMLAALLRGDAAGYVPCQAQ
jgi:hypothetical protein